MGIKVKKEMTESKYGAFAGKDEDEGGKELRQCGSGRVPVGGLICHPKRISPWLHFYLLINFSACTCIYYLSLDGEEREREEIRVA